MYITQLKRAHTTATTATVTLGTRAPTCSGLTYKSVRASIGIKSGKLNLSVVLEPKLAETNTGKLEELSGLKTIYIYIYTDIYIYIYLAWRVSVGRYDWVIWRGQRIIGRLTFPIHWNPPCVVAHCHHRGHGGHCQATSFLTAVSDELLIDWLACQDKYTSGESHMGRAPARAE
jgi:hypothetical protein